MTTAKKILMAMFQGGGNIPQLLPIVDRLATGGHAVRVIVGPGVHRSRLPVSDALLRSLVATGVQVIHLREPAVHPWEAALSRSGALFGWTPKALSMVEDVARNQVWIPAWASDVAEELQREPADVVVADFFLTGALVAAEAARVPSVALFHAPPPRPIPGRPPRGPGWAPGSGPLGRLRDAAGKFIVNRLYARHALPSLNQARASLGLAPARWFFEQHDRAARAVVLMSPHFDYPTGSMPANVRLVGTPPGQDAPMSWTPPWPAEDGKQRLLVSLSTLSQGQGPLMEHVLEALADLPVHAVVTLGPSLEASRFKPPRNVTLESFVPHSAVLPHVDAVVTQCGLGTVMKGLAMGVPLVCIPLIADQHENAARVVAHGAGVRVQADSSSDIIREAITRVVTEPSFRRAAGDLAAKMKGEDPAQAAVDEIMSVAGEKTASKG